jgi:alpha-galactosidase
MLDHYIREYGLEYIRYDFNMDPLGYWDAKDGPHRRGISQLKHIRGLYSIVDWLRERHPDVRLEAVASGGRRIDLETAKRFHAFWLSDQTVDPSIVRFHLSGVHHFLPGNYHNVAYVLPLAHQKHFDADDVEFQSLFAGALGFSSAFDRWSEDTKRKALLHSQTWRALRRYLIEDYYALGDQPGDLRSWSGWQFHDPRDQSGFVQTFRTNTSEAKHRFMPQGLDASARYRFKDAYGAQSFEITGADAMAKGIEVTQVPMSSRVLIYGRAGE